MTFARVIGVRLDDGTFIGVRLDDGIVSSEIAQCALQASVFTNAVGMDVDCESGDLPMNPPEVGWWFMGSEGVDENVVIEVGLGTSLTKWVVGFVCHEVLKGSGFLSEHVLLLCCWCPSLCCGKCLSKCCRTYTGYSGCPGLSQNGYGRCLRLFCRTYTKCWCNGFHYWFGSP